MEAYEKLAYCKEKLGECVPLGRAPFPRHPLRLTRAATQALDGGEAP